MPLVTRERGHGAPGLLDDPSWCRVSRDGTRGRSLAWLVAVLGLSVACVEKAPPASWPEPPPPILAEPIEAEGREAEPTARSRDAATNSPEDGAVSLDGRGGDAKAPAAATSDVGDAKPEEVGAPAPDDTPSPSGTDDE